MATDQKTIITVAKKKSPHREGAELVKRALGHKCLEPGPRVVSAGRQAGR